MRVGIMLGDDSSRNNINARTDLKKFFLIDKFAMDLLKKIPKNGEIEIKIIRKDNIRNLHTMVNGEKYDFIIALYCKSMSSINLTPRIIYYKNSLKSKKIATTLAKNLARVSSFTNVSVEARENSAPEGYPLSRIEYPCIIAEPFPSEENLQLSINSYKELLNGYIKGIQDIREKNLV